MNVVRATPAESDDDRAVHRKLSTMHPLVALVLGRLGIGIFTLWAASVLVFAATQALPGNAAQAVLGHSATPAHLHALERQLHLNRSVFAQYVSWLGGLLRGHLGNSLANGESVGSLVGTRFVNSAVLVALAGLIGSVLAVGLGMVAAWRRGGVLDGALSLAALTVTALPEFVVALALVILFATIVLHVLPGVSLLRAGTYVWSQPKLLVLPVSTLVIVIVPYIFRMMRGAMIEALESDFVEMARLKGAPPRRLLLVHALPNALAPTIQVIGITFLYLAGGIVIVENVFAYPGVGQGLVNAVNDRDIPVIQFIVLALAAFYVVVNIATDVIVLLITPRRRLPR